MPRTTLNVSSPSFIADPGSVARSTGRQFDWTKVTAAFVNAATGKKHVPAGTVIDQIAATGKIVPRPAGDDTAGQVTIGILASDANQDHPAESLSGYGVITGGRVYTELLPTAPDAKALEALKALDGGGFAFESYNDSRAS